MHHPDYHEISRRFRRTTVWTDERPLAFPGEGVDLYYPACGSRNGHYLLGNSRYTCQEHQMTFPGESTLHAPTDAVIEENLRFRYPLVREHATGPVTRHNRVLLLLHGLNERTFTKYIPWAYHLWRVTRIPVLMFPLTFHINRVLPEWAAGQQHNYEERRALEGNENVHRFNAVISDRLGAHPDRFFWGAIQSYWDLVDLARTIRSGEHPHFAEGTQIDMLGFSAGGYVSLALLLENTEGLFDRSRGVLFASGLAVRDVNLSSHLIVDHRAEVALMKLYVKYRERMESPRLHHWLTAHPEGAWFDALCGLMPKRAKVETRLREMSSRLLGIANTNDQVMPPGGMLNALQGIRRDTGVRVEELELGIHENPFASPDYNLRDRSMITDFMNVERYGTAFERFVTIVADHMGRAT
jgi:hypothetical protein